MPLKFQSVDPPSFNGAESPDPFPAVESVDSRIDASSSSEALSFSAFLFFFFRTECLLKPLDSLRKSLPSPEIYFATMRCLVLGGRHSVSGLPSLLFFWHFVCSPNLLQAVSGR